MLLNRHLLTASMLIVCAGYIPAQTIDNDENTPIAVFTIPQTFDAELSLNTDKVTGLTPYNLYTNPKYQGDILHRVFSDFSGPGYITYNYSVTDLHDADGLLYYPLWLLGFDNSGGEMTLHFSQDYISDYGVSISKIIIRDAQNRFSTSDISVTVNGETRLLPYTPNSNNIPVGNESLKPAMTIEFDFTEARPVDTVEISCGDYGMGFSSIEIYCGDPQSSDAPLIILPGVTDSVSKMGDGTTLTYSIDGCRLSSRPARGLVIECTPDGKTRKRVYIKE